MENKIKVIKSKKWGTTKEILKIIIFAYLSRGGSPTRPLLPLVINEIIRLFQKIKKINIEEKRVMRVLNYLEKREIITLEEKDNSVFVHTVNNNHPTVIKYSIKALLNFKKKTKKWNGKWFMVFFDVPESQRNKRDYLRAYLVKLGFYPYQKSVYLFPYECEKEVILIKKIVEGAKYMKYIVAEKIEDENPAKTFFHLN